MTNNELKKHIDKRFDDLVTLIELNTNNTESKVITKASKYKNGISIETSKYGGVKVEAIEILKSKLRKKGDDYAVVVGRQADYYCFLNPWTKYTPEIEDQIKQNQDKNQFTSKKASNIIAPFYRMKDGNPDYDRKNPKEGTPLIKNHATIAYGNYDIVDEDWKEQFFDKISEWFLLKFNKDLTAFRSKYRPYK